MATLSTQGGTVTHSGELIVVLGMHRSGTSAVAEVLARLGATLTPQDFLMPKTAANARGHFEDERMVAINDWILKQHGASWGNPWPLRGVVPSHEEIQRVQECWNDIRADGVNVVKDPRLCVTLPWWEAVWAEQTLVTYLNIIRHPSQVAQSLQTRDGMPIILGELLWHEYVTASGPAIESSSSLLVLHEDLMRDPDGVSDILRTRLSTVLGQMKCSVISPINPVLQHHHLTEDANAGIVASLWSTIENKSRTGASREHDWSRPADADLVAVAGSLYEEWKLRRHLERRLSQAEKNPTMSQNLRSLWRNLQSRQN